MTKCRNSKVLGNVFICDYPIISYGSVDGGIPKTHTGNNYDKWCEEMGFVRQTGSIQTKMETVSFPQGWVFGCTRYDFPSWHWCDSVDGYWYNDRLDSQGSGDRITQVKCELKKHTPPACASGNHTITLCGLLLYMITLSNRLFDYLVNSIYSRECII